jgi:type II secretory pathway component PulF
VIAADLPMPGPSPETAPSLPFSMRMFAEETAFPWTKSAFRTIANRLEQGASWRQSVAGAGLFLPRFLRGVFAIAERSGSIEQVIVEYLSGSRRTRRARRSVIGALLYPCFLLLAASALATGIFGVVIPPFKTMFNDFGMELPAATKTLIGISDIIVATWHWWVACFALVFLVLLGILISSRLPFAAPIVRTFQAIPILGTASMFAGASEFCILLGMLVRGRIPLPEALRLTAKGMRDTNLRAGCLRLAKQVEAGESPAYAASIIPNFGPRLVQLLRHTDHERSFGEILQAHGELFAIQAEAQAGIAVVWMQPLLLVSVALFGMVVVVSLFAPLFKLLNELS